MKKYIIFVLGLVFLLVFGGCASHEREAGINDEPTTGDLPPMITILDKNYVAPYMPIEELPDGYEYIGDLSKEAANDTGLAGCKMYVIKGLDSLPDFYLYQECGTPISEDTVDITQRQWAYVQWICSGMSGEAKEKLTIEKTIELSEKGNILTWSDFEQFESSGDVGSGLYIIRYDMEEPYFILVGGAELDAEPMYIHLVSTQNPDNYIDIRYESVEDFMNKSD